MRTLIGIAPFLLLVLLAGACVSRPSELQSTVARPKVLVLLSASREVTTKEGRKHKTGYFLSELAMPLIALERAGYSIDFVTPNGKAPTMDVISDDQKWFKTAHDFSAARHFIESHGKLRTPLSLETQNARSLASYVGLFVPGGHAPLEDLSANKHVGRLLTYFHNEGKPTALICHGPAALLSAKAHGSWPYAGYKMTGFSTAEEIQEEDAGHLDGHMPFYLEQSLRESGAEVSVSTPWTSRGCPRPRADHWAEPDV